MSKILKITDTTVFVGDNNSKIHEVRKSDLSFIPQIGQEVELFTSDNEIMVIEKKEKENKSESFNNEKGININIQNQNNPAQPIREYYNSLKLVNKTVYIVLALFLGFIGIHKFYAGRVGTGILYMLFCFTLIPAFIAFVEMIVAIFKPSDSLGRIYV